MSAHRHGSVRSAGEPCECWGLEARIAYAIASQLVHGHPRSPMWAEPQQVTAELLDAADELGGWPEPWDLDGDCELCSVAPETAEVSQ